MPDIINYSIEDYGGGTHNWGIEQDCNGVLYFANDEGLLTYDGDQWDVYPLPNKTIVRSIAIGRDHKIYVGGQGDFGYFSPNARGQLVFVSLLEKIPVDKQSFADIWNIADVGGAVFFRSESKIFRWQDNRISVFESEAGWLYMGGINNQIVAQDKEKGLLKLTGDVWSPWLRAPTPDHFVINGLLQHSVDNILISSTSHGLCSIADGKLVAVEKMTHIRNVSHSVQIDEHTLAVSTIGNGCYILDKKSGKQLYHLSKSNGLKNNNVLSLHSDYNGNLWLGFADGIGYVATSSAIKHINPEIFDHSGGHTSVVFNQALYFGLSNGLFKVPLDNVSDISAVQSDFTPVPDMWGQVWGLDVIDGTLLIGRHEGAYGLQKDDHIRISEKNGHWNFIVRSREKATEQVLSGHYNGISIFQRHGQRLSMLGNIDGFRESARFITVDDKDNIWVSHPYKGVYKITDLGRGKVKTALYTDREGLPSTYNNHIYLIKNRRAVGTERGVYEYNHETDRFEPSPFFAPIFGKKYIRYLKEDGDGNIWFIEDKKLGVARFDGTVYQLLYIPELNGKTLGGFEHINCIDKHNVIIGGRKGFYHLNFEKYLTPPSRQKVRVRTVNAFGKTDSLLFAGYFGEVNEEAKQKERPKVKYGLNSFRFAYSSTFNNSKASTVYSCYLHGFDTDWSLPDKRTERIYTNLPPGNYVFNVKMLDNRGHESEVSAYEFTILPPWHQTIPAYLGYVMILGGICTLLYKRHQNKITDQRIAFEKEQEHVKYLHQLEMDRSEKEIVKLKNEKLELEIATKNSELATSAMHLVQKAELISKLKNELFRLKKDLKDDAYAADFNKIIRLLDAEEKSDDSWATFSVHFDKVHVDFLKNLKERYPSITGTELRLSAYLKMNLSTKEIAQLMKISPRGVEIGRYRLRKKLELPSYANLFEFFNTFS